MALYQKQLAKTDDFEEMLKTAVGSRGVIKNISKTMYDITYGNCVFSVLKDKDGGMRILNFFCSKRECEKKFGLPFDVLVKEGSELDFEERRVPMYGRSLIMEFAIPQEQIGSVKVRNIMEQITAVHEVMKDKVEELKARLDAAQKSE